LVTEVYPNVFARRRNKLDIQLKPLILFLNHPAISR
jgi:hypothetical protein